MADERLRALERRAVSDPGAYLELERELKRARVSAEKLRAIRGRIGRCRFCGEADHVPAFTGPACEGSGRCVRRVVRTEPKPPTTSGEHRDDVVVDDSGAVVELLPPVHCVFMVGGPGGRHVEGRFVYRYETVPDHAPLTRARACETCTEACMQRVNGRAYTSRWKHGAQVAIQAALKTSSCRAPEGLAAAVRSSRPYDRYKNGNGMAWANQVWTREVGLALRQIGVNVRAGRPAVDDGVGTLFELGGAP